MSVLYDDIGELVTNDPAAGDGTALGVVADAALVTDGDRIVWLGPKADAPEADQRVDCAGASVLPGFVDSHAHLVFAGDRSAEFAARMSGTPYDGGGIATTVAATRAASDDALAANLSRLATELHRGGVTTFETKSGYGLTTVDERRSLVLGAQVHRRDDIPWRARGSARVPRRPRRLRPARRRRHAGRRAASTRGGSTCSATAAHSTSTRRASSCRPASRPG